MRFVARILTCLGAFVLGADLLAMLETEALTPYTLSWLFADMSQTSTQAATVAARTIGTSFLGALPISLVFLWFGAVLFMMSPRAKRYTPVRESA